MRTQMIDGNSQSDVTPQDLDFSRVEICPSSKVPWLGYSKQTVTQELVRQGEIIHRATSHTGSRRNPSNQDETGSVLRIR